MHFVCQGRSLVEWSDGHYKGEHLSKLSSSGGVMPVAWLLAFNVLRMLRMERMSQCFVSPQLRKAGARGTRQRRINCTCMTIGR